MARRLERTRHELFSCLVACSLFFASTTTLGAQSAPVEEQQLDEIQSLERPVRAEIIETDRGSYILGIGREDGVRPGDEFRLLEPVRSADEQRGAGDEIGLFVVRAVDETISFASLIHANRPARVGDELARIDRLGLESSGYLRAIAGSSGLGGDFALVLVTGVRQGLSRGLYPFRPLVGLEFPIRLSGDFSFSGLVVNTYAGGEMVIPRGLFQIVTAAALGMALSFPVREDEEFSFSHFGGFIETRINYLAFDSIRLGVDIGLASWFASDVDPTYVGVQIGVNGVYRY